MQNSTLLNQTAKSKTTIVIDDEDSYDEDLYKQWQQGLNQKLKGTEKMTGGHQIV